MSSSTTYESTYIEVTPDKHGAFVIIASLVGLIWSVFIIGIRVYLRMRLTPPFGWDDLAAIFGTIVGVIQTSVTLDAVNHGIGTRETLLTSSEADIALKRLYVSWLLYPVAVCSSKVSIALLIARLTRTKYHLWASYALTTLSLLWGIISIFLIAFQCSTPQPWNIAATTQCSTMFAQWAVVESVNMAIELLIPCLIIAMIWSLHMPLGTKITVVLAFSLQLLYVILLIHYVTLKTHHIRSPRVVFPTIIRILFLQQTTTTPASRTDHTFTLTNSTLITEVVMHFSLIAATFPCLRKFLQAFDMHMGATTNLTSEGDTGSSSIALKSLERSPNPEIYRAMPPAPGMGTVTVVSTVSQKSQDSRGDVTPAERRSEESDGSQRVMIRKTQRWEVVSSTH
ncbi:hypothetical protein P170DRAFT_430303 [Aspergillus steynii IBT 23096]|uniref:Rhodopsin domain-containing protein n=1 Tax=Aspergillus steynii IBT 23096 TaxID=1392250 RepID=A0A2I2FUT3_9EURO|nr:uncharacterized protein P170DRAFT_430303 [Aspergillus steynii IBT 23096]PLB44405.1 hypothetical protein P170DRAFT_430303 [Aspergillus steynii IBT 23096]